MYGGNCQGSKDFKTFYLTQKTKPLEMTKNAQQNLDKETASDDGGLGEDDDFQDECIDVVKEL